MTKPKELPGLKEFRKWSQISYSRSLYLRAKIYYKLKIKNKCVYDIAVEVTEPGKYSPGEVFFLGYVLAQYQHDLLTGKLI